MNNKTLSIVSYISIIGWLISYFSYKDKTPKSDLVNYHLKQSLGVAFLGVLYTVAINVIAMIIPSIAGVLSLASIAIIVLWVFGIINAANEVQKPVPLVGIMFEDKFNFIK